MYGVGPRQSRYTAASLVRISIDLVPGSDPRQPFVVTAFPAGVVPYTTMAMPDLPESMRVHLARQEAQPPLETVREFLLGHVADAESLDEVRARLRRIAQHSTRMHRRVLAGLEAVLAASWPPETLARLVGWDANWVLDDPSDAGAAQFLRSLATMLHEVIDAAE